MVGTMSRIRRFARFGPFSPPSLEGLQPGLAARQVCPGESLAMHGYNTPRGQPLSGEAANLVDTAIKNGCMRSNGADSRLYTHTH